MNELYYLSATEILAKIHNKEITVAEAITSLLERIKTVNNDIIALVNYDEEKLLSEAAEADKKITNNKNLGPLFGLPVTIKDNIEVKGMITTGGITGRKDYVPTFDATVVQRLKKAGAIILGKTNCPAFCSGYETQNELYGRTKNPYNLERTVGSSSGGEAAIIAAGGSFIGLGSDTGGSIRWPASFCGVAGLVPTFGRVPRTGTIPPYMGFLDTTQIGPIARTVKDLLLLFPYIMGPDNWDSRCLPMPYDDPEKMKLDNLRVAYYTDNAFVTPLPAVKKVIAKVADQLVEKNIRVEERYPYASKDYLPVVQGMNAFGAGIDPKTAPTMSELTETMELYPKKVYELVDKWLSKSKKTKGENPMLAVEYQFRSYQWDAYRSRMCQFMNEFDAIICPLSAKPAFPHGASKQKSFNGMELLSFTHPYSFVGFPSVTLRGGENSEGLPIGFQILTAHGKESLALKIALYLEEKLGGWKKPPI